MYALKLSLIVVESMGQAVPYPLSYVSRLTAGESEVLPYLTIDGIFYF